MLNSQLLHFMVRCLLILGAAAVFIEPAASSIAAFNNYACHQTCETCSGPQSTCTTCVSGRSFNGTSCSCEAGKHQDPVASGRHFKGCYQHGPRFAYPGDYEGQIRFRIPEQCATHCSSLNYEFFGMECSRGFGSAAMFECWCVGEATLATKKDKIVAASNCGTTTNVAWCASDVTKYDGYWGGAGHALAVYPVKPDVFNCTSCHDSCQNCTGPTAMECTACSAPLSLHNGTCVPICPAGTLSSVRLSDSTNDCVVINAAAGGSGCSSGTDFVIRRENVTHMKISSVTGVTELYGPIKFSGGLPVLSLCEHSTRGTLRYVHDDVSGDRVELCVKDAANTFRWKSVTLT